MKPKSKIITSVLQQNCSKSKSQILKKKIVRKDLAFYYKGKIAPNILRDAYLIWVDNPFSSTHAERKHAKTSQVWNKISPVLLKPSKAKIHLHYSRLPLKLTTLGNKNSSNFNNHWILMWKKMLQDDFTLRTILMNSYTKKLMAAAGKT